MDTPVMTKKQQKQSLSGRKPIKVRNVLAQPHDNYWPVIKGEDKIKLTTILKELLSVLRRPPSKKKKKLTENESKEEPKVSEETFPDKDMLNSVVIGVNAVTRSLEKDAICCVLLNANVEPPFLIKHIVIMAQRKELPVLLVPSFKVLTFETIGFSSTAFGLKKTVLSLDHHFYKLYDTVLKTSKNYPTPLQSSQTLFLNKNTETFIDCSTIEDDKVNDSVSKENTLEDNEVVIPIENIYKFRSSRKERAFIPPNAISDNTKNIEDKALEFISLGDDLKNTNIPNLEIKRYFQSTSNKYKSSNTFNNRNNNKNNDNSSNPKLNNKRKSNNENITYLPLKILKLQGNSNRTKATKAPKKKKPKTNKK